MGGLVIETIRPGVQFTPDAAAAFKRAEAQVQSGFGRNIGVNSTYRSWDKQMSMYNAWNAYVNGTGPYPGHSKAIHPMYSRHTGGTALDSSDWGNARIRQILADNGFIRNQLHVPNEQHHFEYIRSKDKNHGQAAGNNASPATPVPEEDDMKFLYVDDDGAGKKVWVLISVRTGKFITTYSQAKANGWATVWGNARIVKRQEFLNALDAIRKTS